MLLGNRLKYGGNLVESQQLIGKRKGFNSSNFIWILCEIGRWKIGRTKCRAVEKRSRDLKSILSLLYIRSR